MKRVAIVGANGHVGTELCLLLTRYPGIEVIPVCRSEGASALLRRCGLACRHGVISNAAVAPELLYGCDLIVDASLPRGRASELRTVTRAIQNGIAGAAPRHAGIVYLSTIMAIGMNPTDTEFRSRVSAGTVYGATKRLGERLVRRDARRIGRPWWILRLGQVHGVLQSVGKGLDALAQREMAVPRGTSWTVFSVTIAEAVHSILLGNESCGEYVLVSAPPWTWKEVLEFYLQKGSGPGGAFITEVERGEETGPGRNNAIRLGEWILSGMLRRKEWLVAHALAFSPQLETRAQAAWAIRRARLASESLIQRRRVEAFGSVFCGEPAGRRLKGLSDSRQGAREAWDWVEGVLESASDGIAAGGR